MSDLKDAAIYYAKYYEWPVFPLQPRDKRPLGKDRLSSNGEGGLKVATKDHNTVQQWWEKWPNCNIGFACGNGTDIIVLDVDPDHGGDESLFALEDQYGKLPETVESLTGGGGRHILLRNPNGKPIRNSAGKIGAGLDIRGDGGYIVLPPSVHPSGKEYTWELSSRPDNIEIATMPDWLYDLLTEEGEDVQPRKDSMGDIPIIGKKSLEFIASGAPAGVQRDRALSCARNLLASGMSQDDVIDKIWQGLENSHWEKEPWKKEDAIQIVTDLANRPPPPIKIKSDAIEKVNYRRDELEWILAVCAYTEPELAIAEAGWLDSESLSNVKIKRFWELLKSGRDHVEAASDAGITKEIIGKQYSVNPSDIEKYAKQITREIYLDGVGKQAHRLSLNVAAGKTEEVHAIISELSNVIPPQGKEPVLAGDVCYELTGDIYDEKPNGIKTYCGPVDKAIGLLENSTFTILAARPGMGKTTMAFNDFAVNQARAGKRVLYFLLESNSRRIVRNKACGMAGIRPSDISRMDASTEDKDAVVGQLSKLMGWIEDRLYIYDYPSTMDDIFRVAVQTNPDIIYIDHLGWVHDKQTDPVEKLGNVTRRSIEVAKRLDIPTVGLYQLNRGVERRSDKRPRMSDLRGSGYTEENADNIFFIYRDSYYDEIERSRYDVVELIQEKSRDDGGRSCTYLGFDTKHKTFGALSDFGLKVENIDLNTAGGY